MSISTYIELQTAIADFLNRDDLTSTIPTFIDLAEARIARDLRHWKQERRVTTTLDEQYENLPSDFIEARLLSLNNGQELESISLAEMARKRAVSTTAGKPYFFRMSAGQIEVYPAPDGDYDLDLLYVARVPALSDDATTNWLLTDAPDVYLYGSLMQAAPYLVEDERVQVWASLYKSAIDGLNRESNIARNAGPLRMSPPRR